jgi:hypothetical protein
MGAETSDGNASGVTGEMVSSSGVQFASSGVSMTQHSRERFIEGLEGREQSYSWVRSCDFARLPDKSTGINGL